ncbi:glycosyltransferase [Conexibacter sp. W3-3-2]|uniref:glycosyltransferase n=1 Tax=Conexibacter sp. W3-3-2 TaxID=2675227 RepID=UPI0012B9E735|nr:glycosyltransferase [Conexibacter sp. W3-3-2]MTD44728.1 glycosyltransferase [Conexibacter sp. W3-3-2]
MDEDRPHGLDIVCVGFAEWDSELWTNQHHLMSRLAADNRVLFIESLGLRRPTLTGRDLRRMRRRFVRGLRPARRIDSPHGGHVWVLSPMVLPFHGSRVARALNGRLLAQLVRRAVRRAFPGPRGRRALWGYVPQAEILLHVVSPDLVVYHCVDDIGAQDGIDASVYVDAEHRFAARADLVLASSAILAARMRDLNDRVVDAPNVADVAAFAAALGPGPVDGPVAALPGPRLVFTGAVAAKKLDVDLLAGVARARPGWSIALVGPVGLGDPAADISRLTDLPNVHLLGARSYEELPAVLRAADVALIPYRRSPLTDSIFPMKVYEYLAAGLPVVSTPLPSIAEVPDIAFAADVPATVAAVEDALAADGPQERRARSAAAAGHSWDDRLVQIRDALDDLPGASA